MIDGPKDVSSRLAARLFRLLRACDGHLRLVRDADDLDACLAGDPLGVVFHTWSTAAASRPDPSLAERASHVNLN